MCMPTTFDYSKLSRRLGGRTEICFIQGHARSYVHNEDILKKASNPFSLINYIIKLVTVVVTNQANPGTMITTLTVN